MSDDTHREEEPFRPLRPASRSRLIVAFVLGPVLWLVAFVVAAIVVQRTDAIELGLLIAFGSVVVSGLVLLRFHHTREREESRYEARG